MDDASLSPWNLSCVLLALLLLLLGWGLLLLTNLLQAKCARRFYSRLLTNIKRACEVNTKLLKATLLMLFLVTRVAGSLTAFGYLSFILKTSALSILGMLLIYVTSVETLVSLSALPGNLVEVNLFRQLILHFGVFHHLSLLASHDICRRDLICNLIMWAYKLKSKVLEFRLHKLLHSMLLTVAMEGSLKGSVLFTIKHLLVTTKMLISVLEASTMNSVPLSLFFSLFSAECGLLLSSTHGDFLKVNTKWILLRHNKRLWIS